MSINWEYRVNDYYEAYGLYDTNSDGTWDYLRHERIWNTWDNRENGIDPLPEQYDYRYYIDLYDTDSDGVWDRYVRGREYFDEQEDDDITFDEDISELNLAVPERLEAVDDEHYEDAVDEVLQQSEYGLSLHLHLYDNKNMIQWTHAIEGRGLLSMRTTPHPMHYSFGLYGDGDEWEKASLTLREDGDRKPWMFITWNIEDQDLRQSKPYRPELGVQENPYKTNDGNDVANFEFIHSPAWRAGLTTPSRVRIGTSYSERGAIVEDTDLDGTWDTYTKTWRPALSGGGYGSMEAAEYDVSGHEVEVSPRGVLQSYDQGVFDAFEWLSPYSYVGDGHDDVYASGNPFSPSVHGVYPIEDFFQRYENPEDESVLVSYLPFLEAARYIEGVFSNDGLPDLGALANALPEYEPDVIIDAPDPVDLSIEAPALEVAVGQLVGKEEVSWSNQDLLFGREFELDLSAPHGEIEQQLGEIYGFLADPEISSNG